jgi:hypothetical protein
MNNNIGEDRCSFEVSKLLKEKSFSVPVNSYYRISGDIRFGAATHYDWNHPKDQDDYYISCPTHALAIKWIRENFGIHICIHANDEYTFQFEINNWKWYEPEKTNRLGTIVLGDNFMATTSELYNSVKEATEAAILYTLTKLI